MPLNDVAPDGRCCCGRNPGTAGGVTDLTNAKFKPLKNGWVLTSAAPRLDPSRLVGSFLSNSDMRSRAWASDVEEGVCVGKVKGFFKMLRSVAVFDGPAKGVRP